MALCLVVARGTEAQPSPSFRHFDVPDLSHYSVSSLAQDDQGFLWLGTQSGLNRYDGNTFRSFFHQPDDTTSLGHDYINVLHWDDAARALWIGTRGGLSQYDPVTERFRTFAHTLGDATSLSNNDVRSLLVGRDGTLWVGTYDGGLNRHASGAEGFTHFFEADTLDQNRINALWELPSGDLLVGTGGGLFAFSPQTGQASRRYPEVAALRGFITALLRLPDGTLWIGTREGLFSATSAGVVTAHRARAGDPQRLSNNHVYAIGLGADGHLWVSTQGGGLNRMALGTPGRFEHFTHAPEVPQSLSDDNVYGVLTDRMGLLWIGTLNKGLNRYRPIRPVFARDTLQWAVEAALGTPWIQAVLEDRQGRIWMGTKEGVLHRFDPATGRTTTYRYRPGVPDGINGGAGGIWCLYEDQAGHIWICIMDAAVDRFDPQTGRFEHFADRFGTNRIMDVEADADGRLWLSSYEQGVIVLDPATGDFTHHRATDDPASLSHDTVWPIHRDRTGQMWIGTHGGGLNRYDPEQDRFHQYRPRPDDTTSIGSNQIVTISEDADGMLWLGSFDGHLIRFDPTREVFTTYTSDAGLPGTITTGAIADAAGTLWVGTNAGLARFDPATATFKVYDTTDGLPDPIFHIGAFAASRTGRLLFGSRRGLAAFAPTTISDVSTPPVPVLTDFKLFNESVALDTSITYAPTITLPHDQNFLSFEFAALDVLAPEKSQYAYRLLGLETAWVQAGTRRFAGYPGLQPGAYTFEVKAANHRGDWSDETASVRLLITPPYWKTWWFRLLMAASLAMLVSLAYVYRVQQLRKLDQAHHEADLQVERTRHEAELEQERLRLHIAGSLHDEISANLSSISLKSEMIGRGSLLDDKGQQRLEDVHRIAQESARAVRELTWLTNPAYDQLDKLVSQMEDLAATHLSGLIAYRLTATPAPMPSVPLNPECRQHLYYLYREMLNNLVKHAQATQAHIDIAYADGTLRLHIADDGVGFDATTVRAGNGLQLMRHRAEKMGGTFTLDSTPDAGTRLTVEVRL